MKTLCYICEATAGGVRKHLRELVRHFARPEENFRIHALFGHRGEPGFDEELAEFRKAGVQIELVPGLQREIRLGQDRRVYTALKNRLRALKPEIVHTHSSKAGFLGRLAARAAGVPRIIHTPHVFAYQWSHGVKRSFYLALERYAAGKGSRIVCVGQEQREEALAERVAPPPQLVHIPNGVALPEPLSMEARLALRARLELPPQALAVVMVARLALQKGVEHFLNAAREILAKRTDAYFVLIGGGPLEAQVRARAAALGLDRVRMRILGHVEGAENLYPAFDLVALSSLYEGLPFVLLEAMAWGVPVVATDVLGSREAVRSERTGLLARPGDAADLAACMERLLADAPLRARMGAAARERVRADFTLERFLDSHRKLYLD